MLSWICSSLSRALAEMLAPEGGRTVEWEAVGDGPPLMWVEGGPGFWAHPARPDVELVSDSFHCHLVNAPGCGRAAIPAARYVEIAHAGHVPQYEQPGAFRAALLDWLAAT